MIDKFGIITAHLNDPFAIIIDQLLSIDCNEPNAIGFYYDSNGYKNVMLFNSYDGKPVKWISDQYTLTKIIASSFVNKITCYPIIENNSHCSFDYAFNKSLSIYPNNNYNSPLETKFINIIQGINVANKFINTDDFSFIFSDDVKMGYMLINNVLTLLHKDLSFPIDNSGLLQKGITYNNKLLLDDENDRIMIICQKQIHKLEEYILQHCHKNNKIIDLSIFPNKFKLDHLANFHHYLLQIIKSDNREIQELALKNIIVIFNDIILETEISQIPRPDKITSLLRAKIILPDKSIDDIFSNISFNSSCCYQNDLTVLSNEQLLDLLIYIDSLRDSTGLTDIRFAKLQNEITIELAQR
jgi:hypothetical protein